MRTLIVLSVLLSVLLVGPAGQARTTDRAPCSGRNLVASARLTTTGSVRGGGRVADGRLAPEGARWDGPEAVVLPHRRSSILVDLGRLQSVRTLLVQADARDVYQLDGSRDGRSWRQLWRVPSQAPLAGLRTRVARLGRTQMVRHLRLRAVQGDGRYAVSELRAYCTPPTPWPPASLVATYPPRLTLGSAARPWLNADRVQTIKIAVAVLAALLLLWGAWRSRSAGGSWWQPSPAQPGTANPACGRSHRAGAVLLLALGLAAAACWWNLGKFHHSEYVHTWEVYHYYMGAKYFPELKHTRLYDCAVVADAEAGVGPRPQQRVIRDLQSNQLRRAGHLGRQAGLCKAHFSASRWRAFAADLAWFRGQMSGDRWQQAQQDHGYNATPVWGMVGRLLASTGPASEAQVLALALFDPLLLGLMFVAVWWAFGWRGLCLALIFWGTNYPARFFWNGGGYLRQAWLVAAVLSICLMRRQRMYGAGLALTVAALLRIFPGLLVTGLVLNALWRMWQQRRFTLTVAHRRFALGCLTALALLVPLSAASGGLDAWPGFVENSRKHLDTPLTNYMGLKTVVAYSPATSASQLKDSSLRDPYGPWKQARRQLFESRRPVYLLLLLGYLLLLLRAVRGKPDWIAATISIGLIPMATELTCYYMSILLGLALLFRRAPLVVAGLLAYAALGWACSSLWGWYDQQFTYLSLLTVVLVVLATWQLGNDKEGRSRREEAPQPGVKFPVPGLRES